MKKTNRLFFFVVCFFSEMLSFSDHQLSHVCAYSNASVVKFRNKTLANSSSHLLAHPEVNFDWPIDLCEFWISSLYGLRNKKMHNGVDMAALKGTTVKAAGNGTVILATSNDSGYGNMVEIKHKGGMVTRYAHLDAILVSVGKKVKKGDVIGKVGATGNVRGVDPSHLHFEILKNKKSVDPLKYLYSAEINYKNLKNKNILNR